MSADSLQVPSYRRHKASGQAVVTLNGRDIYLGRWNTKASRAEYDRLIGEWLAAGRSLPKTTSDLTVAELARSYWQFAKGYYVKDGRPTGSISVIRVALRWLRESYSQILASDFGPLALEAIQLRMVSAELSRKTVNEMIAWIRRMFRWAVAKQLVSPVVYQALVALPGLRKGRTAAREPAPVKPVADDVVNATLPFLPAVVADMVRLQRLTGCRPGELCILRPCDVDTSGAVWIYRPHSHKTEHHDCERVVCIGPKAQDILRPYLLRPANSYCFCPQDSERKRNRQRRENRNSPMTPSQARRQRKRNPRSTPGDRYSPCSYRRAVGRAVELVNRSRKKAAAEVSQPGKKVQAVLLPHWKPNQLRHTAATAIRKQFGLEAAQVALGHATADVSQIYAERDLTLALEVMRKIG